MPGADGPNLFIVGAPKCGTTTLWGWLAGHPDVYFPPLKEPHYFRPGGSRRFRDLAEYESMYQPGRDRKWRGDASTTYLMREGACQAIREYAPDARIVACVRDPVDLLVAFHAQQCYSGHEPEWDLEKALALDDRMARGESLGWRLRRRHMQRYRETVDLAPQLAMYERAFGSSQVHVVALDRMKADPNGTYLALCTFLEIPAQAGAVTEARNRNRWPRSRTLSWMLGRMPRTYRWYRWRAYRTLRDRLYHLNQAPDGRPALDPSVRARIDMEFAPQRAALAARLAATAPGPLPRKGSAIPVI
jgi:hypothetical protein